MKNIAYKVSTNVPHLPNGFITEYFPTDQNAIEGYFIISEQAFGSLLSNNATLLQAFEANKGIKTADPNAPQQVQVTQVPQTHPES